MITVKNMSIRYSGAKFDTLQDISFDIQAGEIFGFLGPSGAGKSTLQKVLSGVLRDYRGEVRVLDREIKNRTNSFYENIGVDFEFPNFYSKFTAIENLRYFASLYNKEIIDPMVLMERMGLHNDANKKVASYSKGMKMRLGFVRCLVHNPDLLFLDEPTSGLDPANARVLKNIILEQKKIGKTIILTTHNMHDALELCDRVAFIVDGKIKALDTPQALQKNDADTLVQYSYISAGEKIEKTGILAQLYSDSEFIKALKSGTITSVHTQEKTLEDVFIELTGRCLQ